MTFSDAETVCINNDGHLPSLHSNGDGKTLESLLYKCQNKCAAFPSFILLVLFKENNEVLRRFGLDCGVVRFLVGNG